MSIPGLFLLVLLCGVVWYKTGDTIFRERALTRQLRETEDHIRKAELEIEELKSEIAHSQDPEVIERIAKEQFNLQQPGEEVAVIVSVATETAAVVSTESYWQAIKRILFGIR